MGSHVDAKLMARCFAQATRWAYVIFDAIVTHHVLLQFVRGGKHFCTNFTFERRHFGVRVGVLG